MAATFSVDASRAFVRLDAIGPTMHRLLVDELTPIAADMLAEAKSNAVNHFHSVGAKPGAYLAAFSGGVSDKGTRVTGYLRNASPLAHLLEDGFTIKDMIIEAKSGVMAFDVGGIAKAFARSVHRHATAVSAYPAIRPAFEAKRSQILAALQRVADKAGAA